MLKEKIEKMKSLIVKGNDNKKKIENIAVFIVILVITIIAINIIFNGKDENYDVNNQSKGVILADTQSDIQTSSGVTKNELEEKLENILNKIEGVGNVKVMVTYSETSQTIAMYNENNSESITEENDTGGGVRTINETSNKKEVIYKEVDGEKIPVTQSIISPKVEGAIVAANGANVATTKTNIIQAVEAVTGLPTHKIQVFEMKK